MKACPIMARRTAIQSFGPLTVARSKQLASSSGSGAPIQGGSRDATVAAGAANVTVISYESSARFTDRRRNSAALPVGSSRGVKRAPVAKGR